MDKKKSNSASQPHQTPKPQPNIIPHSKHIREGSIPQTGAKPPMPAVTPPKEK